MIVKIDLLEAYDRINWLYLQLLMTHLGFSIDFINWVMGFISNVTFVVLINGAASPFFHSQGGLKHGCPLSPRLFLLVEEGLSQFILAAKRRGDLKGIEITTNLFITHLLFVDDILLFSNGSRDDVQPLKFSLDLFLKATGMCINAHKS